MYRNFGKRWFDFLMALIGFIVLLPVFLFLYVVLWIAHRGNPIFVQPRPGKEERIFHILKFKTMNDKVDKEGNLLPDEQRLTPIGAIVRKTSLDEIPQLINVLKGDMSFIGPRPLLIRYLPYYTETEHLRHSVRPGITGLAQVSGRNLLNWDERLNKDVEYVKNLSFALDLVIFAKTLKNVLLGSDVVVLPSSALTDLDEYRS